MLNNIEDNLYTNQFNCADGITHYYQGEMHDNKFNGFGRLWTKRMSYTGDFCENDFHGYGYYSGYKSIKTYKGEFDNGKMTGYAHIIYHDNEFYIGNVLDGKKHGYGILYNSNGCIKIESNWNNNKAIDTTDIIEYYENGNIKYDGEYNGENWHGIGNLFWKNNNLKFEGSFNNGYYEKGTLWNLKNEKLFEGSFKLNDNGLSLNMDEGIIYHPNGNKYIDASFHNNQPYGLGYEFLENGKLHFKGEFYIINEEHKEDIESLILNKQLILNYKFGKFYFQDSTNLIEFISNFNENGQLHGLQKEFYKNGNIKSDKFYDNNIPIGIIKEYYQNGKLHIEHDLSTNYYKEYIDDEENTICKAGIMENNKIISGIYYYPSSNKLYEGLFSESKYNENGILYYDNENNSTHYDGEFNEGKYEGEGSLYFMNEHLNYVGSWINNEMHGYGTSYYELTGTIEYNGDWNNGEKHGNGTLYNEDGELIWEGHFYQNDISFE